MAHIVDADKLGDLMFKEEYNDFRSGFNAAISLIMDSTAYDAVENTNERGEEDEDK